MDEGASCLVPVVRDGSVNAVLPALPARDSVADAEHGDDGLLPLAGGRQIVISHGTAVLMTHGAPNKTARNGR